MPYVAPSTRKELAHTNLPLTPGELNYQITKLCLDFLGRAKLSYGAVNEVIGVLECAKLEFYRRAVAPYEDEKIKENGDVYNV